MLLVALMAFSSKYFDENFYCFKHNSSGTRALSQPAFTCSKSKMETRKRCMKSVKR